MTTQPATPLSTLNPDGILYPFAEVFEVTPELAADTAKNIWNIPEGTIITMVLAKIKTACAGAASNLIIGDDDDDNGFILAGAFCGTAVDTVYGDIGAERGAYLVDKVTACHTGSWKVYTSAGKELKLEQSGTLTTAGLIEVFVFGFRYNES